jgi:hypothetical protein
VAPSLQATPKASSAACPSSIDRFSLVSPATGPGDASRRKARASRTEGSRRPGS